MPTREPWTTYHAYSLMAISWLTSATVSSPLFVTQRLQPLALENTTLCGYFCGEYNWPADNRIKLFYGSMLLVCQYLIPVSIMTFCYWKILQKVRADWIVAQHSMLTAAQQAQTAVRKRRVMYVLILMVVVFMASWFPLTIVNIFRDFGIGAFLDMQMYFKLLNVHAIAMTSIVWNPLLYFWMSKRHRKAFKEDIIGTGNNYRRNNEMGFMNRFSATRTPQAASLLYNQSSRNFRRGTLTDPTCIAAERTFAHIHANCFLMVPLLPLYQASLNQKVQLMTRARGQVRFLSVSSLSINVVSIAAKNYGKVLLRGQLDDCVPENFRCFLRNPIVVNVTELVCVMDDENVGSKTPLVSCIVTGNVPLMKEKCSEEGDCHSVTVSCPVANKMDNDIISDNDVIDDEENIIPEKAVPHPPLLSLPAPEDSSRNCFFFNDNRTTGADDSSRGNGVNLKPSCTPVDAVCHTVEMTTVGKSSVACTVRKNGKLHDCLIIWETDKQRCHDWNCLSIHLNCPVLEEYDMILPVQKSVLGLVLSLAFFTGVIAACIGSYFQQVCLKSAVLRSDKMMAVMLNVMAAAIVVLS
uniref:G-protein coupled receptors family 1 profile domain-containing protein n=1 Tax=Setaria digitata TaxID=48799 RepID=A0A915PXG7_9BILA